MAEWNPENGTFETDEFVFVSQTVTAINTTTNEYRIDTVDYRTSNGVEFEDMVITIAGNSFTFSTKFEYAVDRIVDYVIQENDYQIDYLDETVDNIKKLPENVSSCYYFHNPEPSIIVYFDVVGQQRTSLDGYQWSAWFDWAETYTIEVFTNWDIHQQLVIKAVENQGFVIRLKG